MTPQQIELIREKHDLLKERADNLQSQLIALQDEIVEICRDVMIMGKVLDGKLPADDLKEGDNGDQN